jgi:hypothetical protein
MENLLGEVALIALIVDKATVNSPRAPKGYITIKELYLSHPKKIPSLESSKRIYLR